MCWSNIAECMLVFKYATICEGIADNFSKCKPLITLTCEFT